MLQQESRVLFNDIDVEKPFRLTRFCLYDNASTPPHGVLIRRSLQGRPSALTSGFAFRLLYVVIVSERIAEQEGTNRMKISSKKNSHFDREVNPADTYLRDYRNRSSLFDSLEEGGNGPTSSYSSSEIAEQENERGVGVLQDRVSVLRMLTADIHDEVNGHNRLLERMEQEMDSSRGLLAGTMDRFRRVFETKSTQSIFTTVGALVIAFLLIYYFLKW